MSIRQVVPHIIGNGEVVSQSPPAGAPLGSGTPVLRCESLKARERWAWLASRAASAARLAAVQALYQIEASQNPPEQIIKDFLIGRVGGLAVSAAVADAVVQPVSS